ELLVSQKTITKQAGKTTDLTPLSGKFDVLGEHLAAIRDATKQHTDCLRSLLEAQQSAPNFSLPEIDLTPLTDRLNRIQESLQRHSERGDTTPGTGDAKFIMSALSSHLSKIQSVTEANAQHVRTLREKQSATQEKMHIAVASTSDAIAALNQHASAQQERMHTAFASNSDAIAALNRHASAQQDRTNERVEGLNGQVGELMAGQREMVEVMRELAGSITAQNKGACDHVVVPPPRKVGRRIVGFVYDAKDGAGGGKGDGKRNGEEYWKGL
ncbi:hypothetical protein B0A55_11463, partial [Friedmanniomyces simplex]